MYSLTHDIRIGDYRLGLVEKVDIHRSVELLADTATITLPESEYNQRLELEKRIKRGDRVDIFLGYKV